VFEKMFVQKWSNSNAAHTGIIKWKACDGSLQTQPIFASKKLNFAGLLHVFGVNVSIALNLNHHLTPQMQL